MIKITNDIIDFESEATFLNCLKKGLKVLKKSIVMKGLQRILCRPSTDQF